MLTITDYYNHGSPRMSTFGDQREYRHIHKIQTQCHISEVTNTPPSAKWTCVMVSGPHLGPGAKAWHLLIIYGTMCHVIGNAASYNTLPFPTTLKLFRNAIEIAAYFWIVVFHLMGPYNLIGEFQRFLSGHTVPTFKWSVKVGTECSYELFKPIYKGIPQNLYQKYMETV
jgi:hypothetical protein